MKKLFIVVYVNAKKSQIITITNPAQNPFTQGGKQSLNTYTLSTLTGDEVVSKEQASRMLDTEEGWNLITSGYNVVHFKQEETEQ